MPRETIESLITRIEESRKNPAKIKPGWRDRLRVFAPTRTKIAIAIMLAGATTAALGARTFLNHTMDVVEANEHYRVETYNRIVYNTNDTTQRQQDLSKTLEYSSYAIAGGTIATVLGGILWAYRPNRKSSPITRR